MAPKGRRRLNAKTPSCPDMVGDSPLVAEYGWSPEQLSWCINCQCWPIPDVYGRQHLQRQFVRFKPVPKPATTSKVGATSSGGSGVMWLCMACGWKDGMSSADRAWQHVLGEISVQSFAGGVDDPDLGVVRESHSNPDKEKRTMITELRWKGNRRATPCKPSCLLKKLVVIDLARHGIAAAEDYCAFMDWQFNALSYSPKKRNRVTDDEIRDLQKLHVLTVTETDGAFTHCSHPRWAQFLRDLRDDYIPPNRILAAQLLDKLFVESEEHKHLIMAIGYITMTLASILLN